MILFRFFRSLFLTVRFFIVGGVIVGVFCLSFVYPFLFPIGQVMILATLALLVVDLLLLYNGRTRVSCKRKSNNVFSLGEENPIILDLYSEAAIPLSLAIIDELPSQLQIRDFRMSLSIKPGELKTLEYNLRPIVRGEYHFGKVHLFLSSQLGLIERRISHSLEEMIPVYPSIMQMKQFELRAFAKISTFQGIKKIRRLGHSYEFEQIKNYVRGDDYRSINWKATGRRNDLMVNQYEDEKAQQVYCVIDKSRTMKLPFEGLSLMDHAINTSLVISNIALQKQDKAGLLTFSDKIGTALKAERSKTHLRKILNALYNEKERHLDSNYELLYHMIRNFMKGRSLVLLFTNFESQYALERALPILRKINRLHLLVVIFFENTEIISASTAECTTMEDIYNQTIAEKFVHEKRSIVEELRKHHIQSVLTRPEDLALNTINKYLELKARGLI